MQEITQRPAILALGKHNMPSIRQARLGPKLNYRTRHVNIRGHKLSEMVHSDQVDLRYTSTSAQLADHLTKAMSGTTVQYARGPGPRYRVTTPYDSVLT